MACVGYANFVVIINGVSSRFFQASSGLSKGCPLSPLYFLIIVEGLSRKITKEKEASNIVWIIASPSICVTHSLFVDNVSG